MNRTAPNALTVLVLCPLCGLRKTVDSFIDPFTCVVQPSAKSSLESGVRERKMRGNKAVPQLKWTVTKRSGPSKARVYRAKLVFHRTIH